MQNGLQAMLCPEGKRAAKPMKLLIIQQKMIGDVLTSSILCENLKRHFPHCHIRFIANENTLAVIEGNPFIDEIIVFKNEYRLSKRAFFRFLRSFRKTPYNILIDAYGKTESNLITLFARARLKISYYKWYTRFLYTHPLHRHTQPDAAMGLAIKNRLLLLLPLLKEEPPTVTRPRIYLSTEETEKARDFLDTHNIAPGKPLFMLNVLGSSPSKTYPLPYMARVIDVLVRCTEATFLFNYIPSQAEDANKLYELCGEEAKKRIRPDVFAPSLRDFLGVLSHCQALIGNEGGAVNMAKALNIPTFSIFSPCVPKEGWDLFGDEKNVAVHLKDFKPGWFAGISPRQLKKNTATLYKSFTPSYFENILQQFLNTVTGTG